MKEQLNSDFFAGNRARLRELFTGTAPIIVSANGLMQRNSDVTYPFRQDSSFWYLTGIEEPDIVLVMDKGREYLLVPDRDSSREAFDGAIDSQALSRQSGIDTVLGMSEGWQQLNQRLKKVKHVATLAPPADYIEQHGIYTNPAKARLLQQVKASNSDISVLDIRQHMMHMRSVKQRVELEQISAAIAITGKALAKLSRKNWANFEHEYEIEAAITSEFMKQQATHAYSPIIASGAHACTLHYVANNGAIQNNSFLLLDVGAEFNCYAADITRTYQVGSVSKRHTAVYEATQSVQKYAFSLLKPGITLREVEELVQDYMGEKLRELGLIKTIEATEVRKYYPHATSHFLGLDVHDVGDYERPLEAGNVLTVEPGIYIPEETIGVRIEDNILITADGYSNLSNGIAK